MIMMMELEDVERQYYAQGNTVNKMEGKIRMKGGC
jgi:hypothetical protein